MTKVTVELSMPWPTAAGLRRPFEGPFEVSEEEAARIVDAGGGKIISDEPAELSAAEKAAAKKAAAEKAAAEKAAAEKAEAEKAANSAQS